MLRRRALPRTAGIKPSVRIKDKNDARVLGTYLAKGEAFLTEYRPVVENASIQYVLFCGIAITEANAAISANVNKAVVMIILLSVSILLTVIIASILIVKRIIVRPIAGMVAILRDVGEGDLTARFKLVGNSEITDFSAYFNQTLDKMSAALLLKQ